MNRKRQDQTAVRISDEEYSRLESKFEALKNEFLACRRKLDSKCEALLILSKELDQCRSERDQFKLMAEQLRERHQSMKKQMSGKQTEPVTHLGQKQYTDKQSQNLLKLLYEAKDQNKSVQFELEDTKQKLQDAQGDIKLLREQIARQRVGTTDEGMNTRHFPAHEREELVQKLESSREQYLQLERDLQTVLDEKEEHVTERDVYKIKYERLNQELNYILKGDENRVVDIDGLVMENKFLQDRLKQTVEEKSMAMAAVSKYKSLLEKKKNKSCMKLGQTRGGGMVISQKQVQEVLTSNSSIVPTAQAMADLQGLAGALLDTVNDKNLALSHQRKTNKILGTRVAELEKKIKTLEVAGLWNVSGHAGPIHLEKLLQECHDMKTLVPQRVTHNSESDQLSLSDKESELGSVTPLDSCPTSPEASPMHTAKQLDPLGDLDLLPTKEVPCRPAYGEHNTDSIISEIVKTTYEVDSSNTHSKMTSPDLASVSEQTSVDSAQLGDDELENDNSSGCLKSPDTDSNRQYSYMTSICETAEHAVDGSDDLRAEFVNNDGSDDIRAKFVNNEEEVVNENEQIKVSDSFPNKEVGVDLETDDYIHVYNKDKVDDVDDEDRDDIDRELDLDLDDKTDDTNHEMQVDFNGAGDATSFYNVKQRTHKQVNGNSYSCVEDNDDDDDVDDDDMGEEEHDHEASETIGLLVESVAQKMCNISHKSVKRDSFDSDKRASFDSDKRASFDSDKEVVDVANEEGKLLPETNNKLGDNKTAAIEEPHNVEC